ncbi:hypothetical protein M758_12G187800 [Ceratodon purpureus]|nr:hypothetical protein M758_12G187800 [Ceratodon purpureus]
MDAAAGGPDAASLLPIDIAYAKLADWLVDRKRIPVDWRKKVASLRARIAAALASLPQLEDSWLQSSTAESTGYLEAKRIRELLVEANPESRNFFGRLSGVAGEWDGIVRAYEKELLHLGEAAQIMVHYTDYEIPSQKKEIAKVQQQLTDMEKKEAEYKRNAAAAATRYQQACQELGIKGNDVKAELKALGKSLPAVFMKVVEAICNDKVGEPMDLYQAMVSYAHSGPEEEQRPNLPTLQELRDHPPSFDQAKESNVDDNLQSIEHNSNTDGTGLEGANDSIDWGVDASIGQDGADQIDWGLDASSGHDGTGQIDWGVGVESTDGAAESGSNGIDWGIGAVADDPTSVDESKLETDIIWDIGPLTPQAETSPESDFVLLQQDEGLETGGEINWDIDLDESGVDGADRTDSLSHELPSTASETTGVGRFLETDYRNMLLNDLFELKAFVKQRVEELERQETAALQNQVQAMAPAACFQHGSDALLDMASHITAAIDLLTAQKTRDLCLLVTSTRFLDRLHLSLVAKKESETKLLASLRDLSQKRTELRNSLTLLWPKQESSLKRTREVKEHVEGCISTLYDGRPVNIIGSINTVLGVA